MIIISLDTIALGIVVEIIDDTAENELFFILFIIIIFITSIISIIFPIYLMFRWSTKYNLEKFGFKSRKEWIRSKNNSIDFN